MKKLLALLLVAAPLGAQEIPRNISIVPATNDITINVDSLAFTLEVPPPDSDAVAREEAAIAAEERIADAIEAWVENCGCVDQGPTTVNVIANAGLTVAAFLIAWQLRGIKNRPGGGDGADGQDGQDGADGQDGRDGVDAQDHKHDDDSESEH